MSRNILAKHCSFIHLVCLTSGPQPLPWWGLHTVRSSASSFNSQFPLVSLISSNNCVRLLHRLLVTSIFLSIFPPITCFRRKLLRQMWPIHLAFLFSVYVGYSSQPWPNITLLISHTTGPTDLSTLRQHNTSELSRYFWSTFIHDYTTNVAFY